MKFVHLSDLHLGKKVNEYSMLEDQEYILKKILNIIDKEKTDGVIIAGDIYDKSVPPAEAVQLFDDFIFQLAKRDLKVFVIGGNHDSPERLSFGSRIMDPGGIHFSKVYDGNVSAISLDDEYGTVDIYMLPFIKPASVRRFCGEDEEIATYADAVEFAISKMDIVPVNRNIIVAHQFVTGAQRSESEDISVGGLDNVDASVFEKFDYVALGHIHSPQTCGSDKIRYSGTPLKYSFSEARDQKSVTVIELGKKGNISYKKVELIPQHDMAEIKGKFAEITSKSFYENTTLQEDYIHITLTDEEDVPDAIGKLRSIYHRLMKLDYDNQRTRSSAEISDISDLKCKSPLELFSDFYFLQNNQPMSDEQREFMEKMIEKTWEEKE
ncbi:MAG: exonuclease SbcCD subunit D [Ruminiclostridium sp.]|nr:exonuclease SbcCD subunit D [Ruminiclostridium sp.]